MKITGKVIALHIAESSIRVAEAVIERGLIEVQSAFVINNINRFFNRGRLINLGAMVETVAMSMAANGMTAKRVMISFDNAFTTSFSIDPLSSIPEKKKSLFSGKKDKDAGIDPDSNAGATVKHVHNWGQFITQDEQGEAISTVLGERDMIQSMVASFKEHGYTVLSIEPPDTVLIYTRNTVEYSYDSLNKIVVYADNEEIGDLYVFTKDVPSTIKRIQFDSIEGSTMCERIRWICSNEISRGQMRNPYVYLIGDAFAQGDDYTRIAEDLEFEGIQVIDLYGYVQDYSDMPRATQIRISDEAALDGNILSCEFGVCMCLFLRCFDKKTENMYDGKLSGAFSMKNALALVNVIEVVAVLILVVNMALTALTGYEVLTIRNQLSDANTLQSQLSKVEEQRANARTQIQALGTIDTRLQDVFTFIYENVDPSLNIASVDTIDMIPVSTGSASQYDDEAGTSTGSTPQVEQDSKTEKNNNTEEQSQTATSSATSYVQKQLVIRGYSMTSSGPIELYNALNTAGIGDVKLVGHQQMQLPSGEVIYAFELRAGEGATLG